jgi:hypothetical protein
MRRSHPFRLLRRCWLVACAAALWIAAHDGLFCWAQAQTHAQALRSAYSSTAPEQCHVIGAGNGVDDSTVRVCPGKSGWQLLVAEDDLRETVSIGRNRLLAEREPAASAWFGPFNSAATTVEWRMQDGRPFAIIQRWQIDDSTDLDGSGRPKPRAMLVVTRLPPGKVCHVAYVDVAANADANALARKAADDSARDFRCGKDEVKVIGATGRAVELAIQR